MIKNLSTTFLHGTSASQQNQLTKLIGVSTSFVSHEMSLGFTNYMLNMSSNNKVTCQGSSCVNDPRSTINSKVKPNPKLLRLLAWLINELIKHKIKYKINFVQLRPKFLLKLFAS
jgi:hypothetical protein